MHHALAIQTYHGPAIQPWLDDVAGLRVSVFRDWPYLYDGDLAYEREYLAAYADSKDSVFVLALDEGRVVGASTGLPLRDDSAEFQQPFLDSAIDPAHVFYFGESVLLPAYRGRGMGHAFFDAREDHARGLRDFRWTAFAAVDRDAADPRKPADHRGNDSFWSKRGYSRQPGLTMHLHWNEIDQGQIDHALTVWTRPLERGPLQREPSGRDATGRDASGHVSPEAAS